MKMKTAPMGGTAGIVMERLLQKISYDGTLNLWLSI